MAYSLNADVINEFKSLDTTGIMPTSKIDEFITQSDAYIDGRIGLIYITPITGVNSLIILKKISIGMTAQRIKNILKTKSASPEASQEFPNNLIREAREDLKMIIDRTLLLSDATEKSTDSGVSSYTSENTVERQFKINEVQW